MNLQNYLQSKEEVTADGIKITFSLPAPRIVDISRWPHFTVEWLGMRFGGKWLSQDSFQLMGKTYFRLRDEDYETTVIDPAIYLDWLRGDHSE